MMQVVTVVSLGPRTWRSKCELISGKTRGWVIHFSLGSSYRCSRHYGWLSRIPMSSRKITALGLQTTLQDPTLTTGFLHCIVFYFLSTDSCQIDSIVISFSYFSFRATREFSQQIYLILVQGQITALRLQTKLQDPTLTTGFFYCIVFYFLSTDSCQIDSIVISFSRFCSELLGSSVSRFTWY